MRLIEKVWFYKHPARFVLVPILIPFTLIFFVLSSIRRWMFKLGLKQQVSADMPVVVVGNIGIGGNGKTPVVIELVKLCQSLGFSPGVISRGYGSNAESCPYLLNKSSTAEEAGDEPLLIYQRTNVPVVIGADRIADAKLLDEQGCNIVIADDGLQHYKLARDLEIIVVDGKRQFGNRLLLPAGPLREGIWRLKAADLVIINGALSTSNAELDGENILSMELTAQSVVNLKQGLSVSLEEFQSSFTKVNAIAGIGDPPRFFSTLSGLNFELNKTKGFVDHQKFAHQDFVEFEDTVPLLMTEKDAVKCKGFAKENYWYLPVNAAFSEQDKDSIITELRQLKINDLEKRETYGF